MLLFKLPMELFQEVMTLMHHDKPREEAEKVKIQMESLQGRDSSGRPLVQVEGEGMGSFDQQPNKMPVFSG